ncbi:putative Serine/threonine-protein kinase EDR1 [Paratrimastix pyriformis]|uniref:Serine/threonine-protein kinase EDR1 n=1 Tax=Paratrimastix pyriformis TaxID=342808 RepID=A0ABQ8UV07_9EUKA|nr:putative Serine/threonine-protein kinase EDR1 [Paratrimastix pyriformis]
MLRRSPSCGLARALCVLLLVLGAASVRNYYVSPTGSHKDCGAFENPCSRLDEIPVPVSALIESVTISVVSGTYVPNKQFDFSAFTSDTLTISPSDPAAGPVVIACNASSGTTGGFLAQSAQFGALVLRGLRFQGCTGWADRAGGLTISSLGSVITIEDTEFVECSSWTDGGALAIFSPAQVDVTVRRVRFLGCSAHAKTVEMGLGGSVYIKTNGSIALHNVTIENSTLTVEPNLVSQGGGAYLAGQAGVTVDHCQVVSSKIESARDARGGGLMVDSSGPVTITDTTFAHDTLTSLGSGWKYGAGLYINAPTHSPVLQRTAFSGNRIGYASGTVPSLCSGGGLTILANAPHLDACTFSENRVETGQEASAGAFLLQSASDAYVAADGETQLTDCRFEGSYVGGSAESAYGGAAVFVSHQSFVMDGCHFDQNQLEIPTQRLVEGGAAYFYVEGNITIRETVCNGQSIAGHGDCFGAAMYFEQTQGSIIMEHCWFENNSMAGLQGDGGAIRFSGAHDLTIHDCMFFNNRGVSSTSFGGALFVPGCSVHNVIIRDTQFLANFAVFGGAIAVFSDSDRPFNFTFTNLTFFAHLSPRCSNSRSFSSPSHTRNPQPAENQASFGASLYGQGHGLIDILHSDFRRNGGMDGPGVYMYMGLLHITDCLFVNNSVLRDGTVFLLNTTEALIRDSRFAQTHAESNGGGLVSFGSPNVVVTNVSFEDLSAGFFGGAIQSVRTQLTIDQCAFRRCVAHSGSVGLFSNGATAITRSVFDQNLGYQSGAIFAVNNTLAFRDCQFRQNSAPLGGSLAVSMSRVDVQRCWFTNGTALNTGGFILSNDSSLRLVGTNYFLGGHSARGGAISVTAGRLVTDPDGDAVFEDCSADLGGAVELQLCAATITGAVFRRNNGINGGALYGRDTRTVEVTHSLFDSNQHSSMGGAISFVGSLDNQGYLRLVNTTFTQNKSTKTHILGKAMAAVFLGTEELGSRSCTCSMEDVTFEGNSDGAVVVAPGARLNQLHGRMINNAMSVNDPNFRSSTNHTWPMNVRVMAEAVLVPEGLRLLTGDDGGGDQGPLWVYLEDTSAYPTTIAGRHYLPPLEGDLKEAASNQNDKQLVVVTGAYAVPFAPQCRYYLEGNSTEPSAPAAAVDLGYGQVACNFPEYILERVRNGLGQPVTSFRLQLSNDGLHWSFPTSEPDLLPGTYHIKENMLYLVYIFAPLGCAISVSFFAFLAYKWYRFYKLRKATAIELQSWRATQIASVDFSRLKILERIGHGAAGEVFRGDLDGTPVAVKRLFDTSETPESDEQFRHEVSVMRTLRHPHILGFVGATFNAPRIIVTEYMEMGSLFGLLHNDQLELPMNLRLQMCLDMALGISYLHHLVPPIVHRDIKSQNMLVSADMRIKPSSTLTHHRLQPFTSSRTIVVYFVVLAQVSDFGISRLTDDKGIATAAGTPGWSSPEVLRGERSCLPADAFSYGVCCWELVTREIPWDGIPPIRVITTVAMGARLPIPDSCPPVLAALIRDCFLEDPMARPTFDQIVERLGPAVAADPPKNALDLARARKRRTRKEEGAVAVGSRKYPAGVKKQEQPILTQPLLGAE